MTEHADDQVSISDARANLSDLVSRVRLLRRCVMLSQHGKVRAAVIPAELGELINQLGGPDVALGLLTQAAGQSAGAGAR
jgi:prevent-host-death family protein